MSDFTTARMLALRLHTYGDPLEVLRLEEVPVPVPGPDGVRIKVEACSLNPADWAPCEGFMPGTLPRGIGLDVAGIVEAVGDGWTGPGVGERVFGVPDVMGQSSAGAAALAIMATTCRIPDNLQMVEAACLPMVVETATRALDLLDPAPGETLVVNGAGSMVGFAAVQMALERGQRVIAIAGRTFADDLKAMGATVTPYGEGMVDRVRTLVGGAADAVLHTAQVPGLLPDLIQMAGGNASRVMSISDFTGDALGVRTTGREPDLAPRYDVLERYAVAMATGTFMIPIARTMPIGRWREAVAASLSGQAHGKLILTF